MTTKIDLMGKRIDVLGDCWIELVDFMPNPFYNVDGDTAIVNAARTSFLGESKGEEEDKGLLFYLMKHRHTTPFEMCEFKFRVKAPLMTFWQWNRHRTWNINMSSGRYTVFDEEEFYAPLPTEWRLQSKDNKQGSDGFLPPNEAMDLYIKLIDHYSTSFELYQEALDKGIAKELARLYLPAFGLYYTGVMKVDAHNLMHFLKLRMGSDAQHEIRVFADAIYNNFFIPLLPQTAEAFELYLLKDAWHSCDNKED